MHNLSHKYTKEKEEDRIDVLIIKMTSRQEIDNLVEIEGHCIEAEEDLARMVDKIMEGDHKTILGMTTEEKIIEIECIGIEVELETITDTYRDSSRDECKRDSNVSRDRSRMRQTCSLPRREDRRK